LLITLPGVTFWSVVALTLHLSQIHFTSLRVISIKPHFLSAWSSLHYKDGHINVCTEGRVIWQGANTVHNYFNNNSEVCIINQALLYIPLKTPLKFQREIIKNIPSKTPTLSRKFLEELHTNILRWWKLRRITIFIKPCCCLKNSSSKYVNSNRESRTRSTVVMFCFYS
jgi:hypothetical protein